jgi:hypothetical protein
MAQRASTCTCCRLWWNLVRHREVLLVLAFFGNDTGIYKVLLVLHILSAIVGLGAVMLNGLYAAQMQKWQGPPARAISEANFNVSAIAEYVIYTIPVWGILLVLASHDDIITFDQTWVWLSLLLFVIALGISHSVMIPGHRKINALLAEIEQGPPPADGPPPQVAQIQELGKRQAMGGAALNIIAVVILILMIWKPGFP